MGSFLSKKQEAEARDGNHVKFALVGATGCGKSAFVNAIRGIGDVDKDSAGVGGSSACKEPKEYTYPTNPLVSFWDLPGYGTSIEMYWRKLGLEKFDRFLIFISPTVTEFDRELIQKLKSNTKPFFVIRTKIDSEFKSHFQEEEFLHEKRDYLLRELNRSLTEKDIFLINNYDPRKWDFMRLIEAVSDVSPEPEIATLTDQYMGDTRKYVKENGVSNIEEFLKTKLERSKEVKIRFGITGDSGTGKSAFINAIRGLKDDENEKGAAEVGVTETTIVPAEYKHPENEKIIFVDMPGIGTPKYSNFEDYCEKVCLEKYDSFLIFTASRFTDDDLFLAEKIKSMRKSFFLIRTKIDNDLAPKYEGQQVNEEQILNSIRAYCFNHVKDLISGEEDIFLISNYHKEKWDFDRLIVAISDALSTIQRECLTLSLTNVTRDCLKRKAKLFKAQAVAVAVVSAGSGAVPVPGLGCVLDLILIGGTIRNYYRAFGLGNTTPEELELLNKHYRDIIKRYGLTSVLAIFKSAGTKTALVLLSVEEVSKFIPILGLVIAGSASFATSLYFLNRSVNEMEEVALAVWDNAAERAVNSASRSSP
ncbi:interferon-inducible GTPase 5-like [Dendronephthya gigantea]|uniref:interferon-inducible GTPase 5-like n=1 Tax=Dendronephthya gigantea TaxID=151771 RepID=UPI00106AD11C|nr:interferon-inducible GTPase 5-like [Dendronephthya gigantea]